MVIFEILVWNNCNYFHILLIRKRQNNKEEAILRVLKSTQIQSIVEKYTFPRPQNLEKYTMFLTMLIIDHGLLKNNV